MSIAIVGGCGRQSQGEHSSSEIAACPPRDADTSPFTLEWREALSKRPNVLDEATKLLRAIDAQPFWCGHDIDQGYRVVWMPSYRPNVVVSVTRLGAVWKFQSVEFADPRNELNGGPSRWQPVRRVEGPLSDEAARSISGAFGMAPFWSAPAWPEEREIDDGTSVLIEGRAAGAYQVVVRPDGWTDERLRRAVSQMLGLAARTGSN